MDQPQHSQDNSGNNPTRFCYVNLDLESERLGCTLTYLNQVVIRNLIATYADDLTRIHFDPDSPVKAAIESKFIHGAIQALEHLLQSHPNP